MQLLNEENDEDPSSLMKQRNAGCCVQVDNDGTAVPITSAQDAQSSGDEGDADEDMEGDEDNDSMHCQDASGDGVQQQMPIVNGMRCAQESGAGGGRQKAAPVVDDDGFQLVQRGRRR